MNNIFKNFLFILLYLDEVPTYNILLYYAQDRSKILILLGDKNTDDAAVHNNIVSIIYLYVISPTIY